MSRNPCEEIDARLRHEGRGPENLRELLACISRHPAMYLGETSLTSLGCFLSGYAWASRFHGAPEAEKFDLSGLDKRFVRWLEEYKGIGYGSCGPLGHLRQICESESIALARFFELLDEYEEASDEGSSCDPASGSSRA